MVDTRTASRDRTVKPQPKQYMDSGALGRDRTCDLPLRRRQLYPLSYEGFPPQNTGGSDCSGDVCAPCGQCQTTLAGLSLNIPRNPRSGSSARWMDHA
jgi:hypothetical protein